MVEFYHGVTFSKFTDVYPILGESADFSVVCSSSLDFYSTDGDFERISSVAEIVALHLFTISSAQHKRAERCLTTRCWSSSTHWQHRAREVDHKEFYPSVVDERVVVDSRRDYKSHNARVHSLAGVERQTDCSTSSKCRPQRALDELNYFPQRRVLRETGMMPRVFQRANAKQRRASLKVE